MSEQSLRALVVAPSGRNAAVAQTVLSEIGVPARTGRTLGELLSELERGAGLAIITDNAVQMGDLSALASWVSREPHWSDFPFIVITHQGGGIERNPAATRITEILGNVTFLERPFHATTLISMTRAALRARKRQYDARDKLEQLRKSEERLRLAHQIGNIGDWSWDMTTNQLSWSENTFRMHGVPPSQGAPSFDAWVATIHPEDRARVAADIEAAMRGERSYDCQLRVIWPNGEIHWLQARGESLSASDGLPTTFFGTTVDISTIKAAEAALSQANERLASAVAERTKELSQSEARFRAIFNSAFQLSGLIDLEGTLIVANQTALDAIGAKLADVVGTSLWRSAWLARVPQEVDRMKRELKRAAAGEFVRYELKLILPDNNALDLDFSMRAVRDDNGQIAQILLEGRDISELKRTSEALMQSQKMEVVGQLTGGVAHDFNNLLMAVLGNLDILRKHVAGDARAERLVAGAMQGAKRGATLTSRLLAFARKQELHAEAVDLCALVEGMRELLARSVGPLIEVELAPCSRPVYATVDPHQLELAILNLAVNSRDAMPGGGTIVIAVDEASSPPDEGLAQGRYVRVRVRDNGSGMDAATLRKAIEPFFSTKQLGKGTGLGLSMVHGLAVQSGGTLRMTSAVGSGTTAELWLPAAANGTTQIAEEHPAFEAQTAPKTILVVDDDALIAMSTADMLQDLGHDVVEAHSGAKALEILRNKPAVELMITDYAMPGMTGLQLARAAREIRPDLRILLATGYADLPEGTSIDLPRLAKPYMQYQLATQIAKILAQ